MTKPTKWVCAQRRLRSAWASTQSDQYSLCIQWTAKDPRFLHGDSDDSDQTGQMPRLIWVFAGRTLTLLVLSCPGSYYWSGYFCMNLIETEFSFLNAGIVDVHSGLFHQDINIWATSRQNQQNGLCILAKTQIRLGSLITVFSCQMKKHWILSYRAHSDVSDPTGRMPRLIWVFTGRTGHIVGFVVLWLKISLISSCWYPRGNQ